MYIFVATHKTYLNFLFTVAQDEIRDRNNLQVALVDYTNRPINVKTGAQVADLEEGLGDLSTER